MGFLKRRLSRPDRVERVLAGHDATDADSRRRGGLEPPQPETQRERVLCYSPGGAYAHDDLSGPVPRPACHGGAKRYTRAVSPDQKLHAAALKPCPHCARLRESSETEAAS